MNRMSLLAAVLCALLALRSNQAIARGVEVPTKVDVPIALTESAGVARLADPVSVGVPMPRNLLKDTARLCLLDPAGKPVPAQFDVLMKWYPTAKYPEAAGVKWVLVDFLADVPANGTATYRLVERDPAPTPEKPVSVKRDGDLVTVDTGRLRFTVNGKTFRLFEGVELDGKKIVEAANDDGMCVEGMDGKRYYASRDLADPPKLTGADYHGSDAYLSSYQHNPPEKLRVVVEKSGPLRAVILIDGVITAQQPGKKFDLVLYNAAGDKVGPLSYDTRDEQLGFRIRIHACAGQPFVRVYHTVINLKGKSATATDQERYRSAAYIADAIKEPGKFLVEAMELATSLKLDGPVNVRFGGDSVQSAAPAKGGRLTMYQDSSAGWIWQVGEEKIYDPVLKANVEWFKQHPGLDKPFYEYGDIHYKILTGQDGCSFMGYKVYDEAGKATASGNRLAGWVDVSDGKAGLTAAVRWFWRTYPKSFVVDGNGRLVVGLLPKEWSRGHFLDGKIHRTHELLYRFHAAEEPAAAEASAKAFDLPLVAYCGFDWYLASDACNQFARPDPKNWPNYEGNINTAVHVGLNPKVPPAYDSSYEIEREKDDAYGWEHFGDTAKRGFRGHSQFEEFDSSRCLVMHFWRTGDPEFFREVEKLDRFLMNVPCFGGGYGHQHPEPSHNWIQGLIDYWCLTGLPEAREGIDAMQGYYRACWDTGAFCWHFNGRNAAYAINGLRQFFELTGDPKWLDAANANIRSIKQRTNPISGFFGGNPGWFMQHVLCHALGRYAFLTGDEDAVDLTLGLSGHFKPFSGQSGGGEDGDCYALSTMLTGDRTYLDVAIKNSTDAMAADKDGPHYRTGTCSSKTWSGAVGGYWQLLFYAMREWNPADTAPPGPVTDLAAEPGPEPGSVKLTWTNTGDDGAKGQAAKVQIKYAPGEIAEFIPWARKDKIGGEPAKPEDKGKVNFWYAENATGEPAPTAPGTKQSFVIKGLPGKGARGGAVTLWFAMKVHDEQGNRSKLSNCVKVTVP